MGDRGLPGPHYLRRSAQAGLAAWDRGKAKGRSPVDWELRPYGRSRCAEHVGIAGAIGMVCPPHRG